MARWPAGAPDAHAALPETGRSQAKDRGRIPAAALAPSSPHWPGHVVKGTPGTGPTE